jgi:glucokinase
MPTKSRKARGVEQGRVQTSGCLAPSRPGLLKQLNASQVLTLLRSHNPCSRADLVRMSGLSAPTVSSTVAYLQRKGLVKELGLGTSNGGRRPDMLCFNPNFGFVAGVDLGGTNIRLAIADLDGKILARWTVSTRGNRTPDKIVNLIHSGLRHLIQQTGISEKRLLAVGLGAPGITDVHAGTVVSAPHLQDWQSVPLRNLLESKLGIPAAVENDVNTAALGESWAGSAKGVSNFVFLAIGTGIGAGIYIGDRLYHGSEWAAGEVGYLLVPGAPVFPMAIDKPGSLESVIGGYGIERAWRQVCKKASRNGHSELHLKPTQVFDLAQQGDLRARKLLQGTAQVLAHAVSNISVLLNTSLIVLGGAIGSSEPLLRATRKLLDRNELARPRLAISLLREDAQLYGAIRLAVDKVESSLFSS